MARSNLLVKNLDTGRTHYERHQWWGDRQEFLDKFVERKLEEDNYQVHLSTREEYFAAIKKGRT